MLYCKLEQTYIWKQDFLPKGLYTSDSAPFSCFHSGLYQWGRVNADKMQAPSVLCEDLNSDHPHSTLIHTWTGRWLPWSVRLADRMYVSAAIEAAEIVRTGYPRSWFVTQPLPLPSSCVLIFSVIKGGNEEVSWFYSSAWRWLSFLSRSLGLLPCSLLQPFLGH